jgi:nitrite reductase/ring-hydroxylating ferredoxin subunit
VGTVGVARRLVLGRPDGYRRRALRDLVRKLLARLREAPAGEVRSAPPPRAGRALLGTASLPPGTVTEALLDGVQVAVCRVSDDEVHVLENTCPHAGGPLGDGVLDGTTLVCPDHGWPFDVRTGRCTLAPHVAVRRWRAWVDGGQVLVDPTPLPPVA